MTGTIDTELLEIVKTMNREQQLVLVRFLREHRDVRRLPPRELELLARQLRRAATARVR